MKALFICREGTLTEGSGERCTLRCGAAAGLRLLAELDYRLIVIDEGLHRPCAARDEGGALVVATPTRLPDNGRRRRRTDPASVGGGNVDSVDATLAGADVCLAACRAAGDTPGYTASNNAGALRSVRHGCTEHGASPAASLLIYRLGDLLFREQLVLQGYYSCVHGDDANRANSARTAEATTLAPSLAPHGARPCFCKPPQPGLLLQARFDQGVDLPASWMIGARLDDVEAGNRAGARTVLIDNGTEAAWRLGRKRVPTRIAPDLYEAALLIAAEGQRYGASGGT